MNDTQENILDNYKNPRNYGLPNKKGYISASSTNISCGDAITVYIKEKEGIVKNITFTAEGCSISIASASLLYQDLIGKSTEYILALDNAYPESVMGIELTISRKRCASLALEAIKNAILSTSKK